MTPPEEAIRRVIQQINEDWSSKRYAEIGEHLAEQVVIAPPGLQERIRGREAYVQSYLEYDRAATTREFSPGEPEVDVIGEVAVSTYPFLVVYELEGKTSRIFQPHHVVQPKQNDGLCTLLFLQQYKR